MVRGYFIFFSLFISSTIEAQNIYQNTFTIENASTSAEAMVKTNDNGFAIAGETTVEGSAESFLTKINIDGSIEWTKVYYDLQSHILISNVKMTRRFFAVSF